MIFISYKKQDYYWRDKIISSLKAFRLKEFTIWSDRDIVPGSNWEGSIEEALRQTKIAILFVDNDFLGSDFIMDKEVAYFVENKIKIYWFLLSDCPWEDTPLGPLQCANVENGLPVVTLDRFSQPDLTTLLKKRCREIFNDLKNMEATGTAGADGGNKKPPVSLPPYLLYTCNRNSETAAFRRCVSKYGTDNNNMLFSIAGTEDDQLKTLYKTLRYNALSKQYEPLGYKIVTVAFHHPVRLQDDVSKKYNLGIFQDALYDAIQAQVVAQTDLGMIPVSSLQTLSNLPGQANKLLLLISVYLPATSFYTNSYTAIIEWLQTELNKQNKESGIKLIFLFNFEYANQPSGIAADKDNELKEFLKKDWFKQPVSFIEEDKTYTPEILLNLGNPTMVGDEDLREWYEDTVSISRQFLTIEKLKELVLPPAKMKKFETTLQSYFIKE